MLRLGRPSAKILSLNADTLFEKEIPLTFYLKESESIPNLRN